MFDVYLAITIIINNFFYKKTNFLMTEFYTYNSNIRVEDRNFEIVDVNK